MSSNLSPQLRQNISGVYFFHVLYYLSMKQDMKLTGFQEFEQPNGS